MVYSSGVDFVKRDKTTVKIDLKLNMFLPPAEDTNTRRPVIIQVHGGGWNGDTMDSGKGTEKLEMGMELAQCGYIFLSIGYRGENKVLPNPKDICCEDIAPAIRWIRSHAGEYGADPERIALMGGSAGAISVLEIAYNRKSKYYDPAICAVLDSCGATKAENIQAGAPPILVVDGVEDFLAKSNRAIVEQAKAAGVPYREVWIPDYGHDPLYPYWASYAPTFFARHLTKIDLPKGLPAGPTGLHTTPRGASTVELKWIDNADNEEGFEIERLPAHHGVNAKNQKPRIEPDERDYTVIGKADANAQSYKDETADPKKIYFYRVRAFNAAGYSEYSELADVFAKKKGSSEQDAGNGSD